VALLAFPLHASRFTLHVVILRIATRRSPLALWQAEHVKALLQGAHPGLEVTLVPLSTAGDRWAEQPLAAAGGKGLFVKELEDALLAGEDPCDAFVCTRHESLQALPPGARVGTSSLRRKAQLLAERPDLRAEDLRGNVGTRLTRLDEGKFDALLLACAGLKRLGLAARIRERLAPERFVPAIAQGVIGLECRAADVATRARLAPLHDAASGTRVAAERALNARLGGSCYAPVAGYAEIRESGVGSRESGKTLQLTGLVAAPDGTRVIRDRLVGPAQNAAEIGTALAERLLAAGGAEILRAIGIGT
jgi:hydroxymethylbilane synthase